LGDGWIRREVEIGGTTIVLPLPAAMNQFSPERDAWTQKMVAPKNEVLKGFYSDNSWRYVSVQIRLVDKNVAIRGEKFLQLIAPLKVSPNDLRDETLGLAAKIEASAKQAGEKDGQDMSWLGFEGPVILGTFDESNAHMSSLGLFAIKDSRNEKTVRSVVVVSSTVLNLKGKVFMILVYEPFVDSATYDYLRRITKELTHAVLEGNK
jgi:hypothetical protein